MLRKPALLLVTPLPLLILVGVLLLAGGSVAAIQATNAPAFCGTCHEMKPYRNAWAKAPHQSVSCVSCHVDPGTVPQLLHKVEALKEVYDHFVSNPKFPLAKRADIPDSRCLVCHKDLPKVTKSGFRHAEHLKRGSCVTCHSTVGHNVSTAALAEAGILATIPPAPHAPASTAASASAETSIATTPSHVKTVCANCHQLAANKSLPCATCHVPPHPPRGTCSTCHVPGPKWTFTHPAAKATTNCTTCHERPKGHFNGTCSTCHDPAVPFAKTKFAHSTPGTASTCSACHRQPSGHIATVYNCASCHSQPGRLWTFSHPASNSCANCHTPPKAHFGSSCASCHTPKVAFKQTVYSHTSSSASCATCHSKPSGHRPTTYNCATCHRQPGRSWAFSHPTAGAAASCDKCHSKPARHVSTRAACTTCHQQKPGTNWAFTHPTSASTACQACHSKPSGHVSTSYSCTTCHRQRPGTSWAFTHPTSTNCEACHRRPSTPAPAHYGSNCSKCHTPSVPFKKAVFTHPKIGTNSPHTSRSYSCATCHPKGPPAWSIPKTGCICHNFGGWSKPGSASASSFVWHSGG